MAERMKFPVIFNRELTRMTLKGVAGALWVMSISQSCQTQEINDNIAAAQKINVSALDPDSRQIILNSRSEQEAKKPGSSFVAALEIAAGLFLLHIRPPKPH